MTHIAIAKIVPSERLVIGWASVVEEHGHPVVDSQGDIIPPDVLEKAAAEFSLNVRKAGEQHQRTEGIGRLVWSLVTTHEVVKALFPAVQDGSIPVGWIVGFKIDDDATWEKVRTGELAAFSIGGSGLREDIGKEWEESAHPRDESGRFTSGGGGNGDDGDNDDGDDGGGGSDGDDDGDGGEDEIEEDVAADVSLALDDVADALQEDEQLDGHVSVSTYDDEGILTNNRGFIMRFGGDVDDVEIDQLAEEYLVASLNESGLKAESFDEAGLMTRDNGVVVTHRSGKQYQIVIAPGRRSNELQIEMLDTQRTRER